MTKKGKVKMGLGDFLGSQSGASQSVNGRVLPSGPDPDRGPDERRGGGGKRYDDDYDGPGARADGADTWRRTGGGGGMDERRGGGGYDHQGGGTAPETGGWRSRGAPQRAGGGGGYGDREGGGGSRMGGGGGRYDDDRRGGGDSRDSGYDNPPPSGDRQRLKLEKRTAPLPLPPMAAKEPEKAAPAPAAKPSGPRSNPFGAAQAVDTTQRDKEIEAKAAAAKAASLRRRDESVRSSKPANQPGAAEDGRANADGEDGGAADGEEEANGEGGGDASVVDKNETGDGESQTTTGTTTNSTDGETKAKVEGAVAPKPVGRWAALRREGGGEDRSGPAAGGFPRRDRDDERRGSSGFEGAAAGREVLLRKTGRGRGGMDREPIQPTGPPAGNAFTKRFGSNFDRDSDRSYPRPSGGGMGGGGGYDRRDDDRRGGMGGGGFERRDEGRGGFERRDEGRGGFERRDEGRGGFDRRDEGRGGFDRRDDDQRGGYGRRDDDRRGSGGYERRDEGRGGGMGSGSSRFNRDEESSGGGGGYQRLSDAGSSGAGPAPPVRPASPPSSLSKMSVTEPQEPAKTEVAAAPEPEPEVEVTPEPEPEPEPEPKEDPVEVARASAAEALESGKRGAELKDFVMAQEKRTTAGALLGAALATIATPQDMKWAGAAEFGPALSALSEGNTVEQVGIIYAVVAKCHDMGFPKEASGAVVQTMFMGMYNGDVCEEEAFIEWKDDVDNPAEGRIKAVTQTTPWFVWLESVDEEEED